MSNNLSHKTEVENMTKQVRLMNMRDWKEFMVGLLFLGLLGIIVLCLFSIPASILMGLRWDDLASKILVWTLGTLYFAIMLGFWYIFGYSIEEWGGPISILYYAGIGLASFLLCATAGLGILKLGKKILKLALKPKKKE